MIRPAAIGGKWYRIASAYRHDGRMLRTTFLAGCAVVAAAADTSFIDCRRPPDVLEVVTATATVTMETSGDRWTGGGITVATTARDDGLHVTLTAPSVAVKTLHLHWTGTPPTTWRYLGDAWERGYGDLHWGQLDAKRPLPWYALASDGATTDAYGVMTGPAALCCWTIGAEGLDLWADVRCGAVGVELGARTLPVCTVTARPGRTGETPFAAAVAFCKQMCPAPRLPAKPVYGFNNWYCDYGDISVDSVRQDAAYVGRLAPKNGNLPFMVIDDGWQKDNKDARGDWSQGNARFPDMAGLAADIRTAGARPGIWVRLLHALPSHPLEWRMRRDKSLLDPSVPAVRAYVQATVARIRGWGYELIKHDFSTVDFAGRWGFKMDTRLCGDGDWSLADRSRTLAEIISDHYRSIREAAGEGMLVLGCNTIGHLAAGVFEMSRTGDDTSGNDWSRTRKMGVNTLAFRAPQHGTFFAVDADCVGQTKPGSIAWERNRQWLELLGRSGTPLLISFKRGSTTPEQDLAIAAALAAASRPLPLGEPLDWFDSRFPRRWRLEGRETAYQWYDARPELPQVPPRPQIPLHALTPTSASTGFGTITPDRSISGGPLTIGTRTYEHGLGLHAVAEVTYACQPLWRRFVAVAGIDAAARRGQGEASIACVVLGEVDGVRRELARSPVLRVEDLDRWHFDVALPERCARLVLRIEDGGDGKHSDHADWVEAGFRTTDP